MDLDGSCEMQLRLGIKHGTYQGRATSCNISVPDSS